MVGFCAAVLEIWNVLPSPASGASTKALQIFGPRACFLPLTKKSLRAIRAWLVTHQVKIKPTKKNNTNWDWCRQIPRVDNDEEENDTTIEQFFIAL